MSHFSATTDGSRVRALAARAGGVARLAAMAVVLAVAIHPSATKAAGSGTDADRTDISPALALGPMPATECGTEAAGRGIDSDDGEDRFDEGDDEFECGRGLEDPCVDDSEDRVDEGDDENDGRNAEASPCPTVDDGKDRRADDGEDHVDEGDDEFDAGAEPTDALPAPSPASVTQPLDLTGPGGLAAVVGLGAGAAWLLRRGRS